jgi:hypothetical protein
MAAVGRCGGLGPVAWFSLSTVPVDKLSSVTNYFDADLYRSRSLLPEINVNNSLT